MVTPSLEVQNIHKCFGKNEVLKGISIKVCQGEIVALMGENGAGKSTLMNIIAGLYRDYQGAIFWQGERCEFTGPSDAEQAGIVMVHQELNLISELSVAENIFLGHEPLTAINTIDYPQMERDAQQLLSSLGSDICPGTRLGKLRVGEQQLVEIARALSRQARLLILDEPTAALSEAEVTQLFEVVRTLQGQGVAILYISHRLEEVFALTSHIAVLRNGKLVAHCETSEINRDQLIRHMVGRDVEDFYGSEQHQSGDQALRLRNFSLPSPGYAQSGAGRPWLFRDIDLQLKAGEVLGVAGLMGAGGQELLEALFGVHGDQCQGDIELAGARVRIHNPIAAQQQGLAYVSDDRKRDGLLLNQSIGFNLSLTRLSAFSRGGWLSRSRETAAARQSVAELGVKCESEQQLVGDLSGGNQQKVVLGKWLAVKPRVLLLSEPTRGVDVGAKAEIYHLLGELAKQGMAILLTGTDLPELIALSDRLLILREGEAVALLEKSEFSQHAILDYAALGGPKRNIEWSKAPV